MKTALAVILVTATACFTYLLVSGEIFQAIQIVFGGGQRAPHF